MILTFGAFGMGSGIYGLTSVLRGEREGFWFVGFFLFYTPVSYFAASALIKTLGRTIVLTGERIELQYRGAILAGCALKDVRALTIERKELVVIPSSRIHFVDDAGRVLLETPSLFHSGTRSKVMAAVLERLNPALVREILRRPPPPPPPNPRIVAALIAIGLPTAVFCFVVMYRVIQVYGSESDQSTWAPSWSSGLGLAILSSGALLSSGAAALGLLGWCRLKFPNQFRRADGEDDRLALIKLQSSNPSDRRHLALGIRYRYVDRENLEQDLAQSYSITRFSFLIVVVLFICVILFAPAPEKRSDQVAVLAMALIFAFIVGLAVFVMSRTRRLGQDIDSHFERTESEWVVTRKDGSVIRAQYSEARRAISAGSRGIGSWIVRVNGEGDNSIFDPTFLVPVDQDK